MRAIEFLTELFNPKTSYKLHWDNTWGPIERHASARFGDNWLNINFVPSEKPDIVEIDFARNDSWDITGEGDEYRIFSTVIQAIREYLQGYQPKIIYFASKGASRTRLYQSLINRLSTDFGYKQFDLNKLSPETREKIGLSGTDLLVLRKSNVSKNTVNGIDEMAGEIHGGVRKALMDKGYEYLGSGIDKQAYLEPGTGQVLVIFGYRKGIKDFSPDQRMFIDWINYCNKNAGNPHLPKFSGFESFKFSGKNYIQARMESLRELPDEVGLLVGNLDEVATDKKKKYKQALKDISQFATHDSYETYNATHYELEDTIKYLGGKKAAQNLLKTVYQVQQFARRHQFTVDLHRGNYMARKDGTIVVNDPFVLWLTSSGNRRSWEE